MIIESRKVSLLEVLEASINAEQAIRNPLKKEIFEIKWRIICQCHIVLPLGNDFLLSDDYIVITL